MGTFASAAVGSAAGALTVSPSMPIPSAGAAGASAGAASSDDGSSATSTTRRPRLRPRGGACGAARGRLVPGGPVCLLSPGAVPPPTGGWALEEALRVATEGGYQEFVPLISEEFAPRNEGWKNFYFTTPNGRQLEESWRRRMAAC